LMRKATLVYCPYGLESPLWALCGWARMTYKYVYFRDRDGGDLHKFRAGEVLLFDGWRDDVVQAVEAFKEQRREWERRRQEFERDLEGRLRRLMMEAMVEWERENPRPVFRLGLCAAMEGDGA